MVFDDRPRDKLGEKGDVQQQLQKILCARLGVPVYVNGVGKTLEGEKGYADGQDDTRWGNVRAKNQVQVLKDKICILEYTEDAQIEDHRKGENRFPVRTRR